MPAPFSPGLRLRRRLAFVVTKSWDIIGRFVAVSPVAANIPAPFAPCFWLTFWIQRSDKIFRGTKISDSLAGIAAALTVTAASATARIAFVENMTVMNE